MDVFSIWPAFACTAVFLAVAALPVFAAADTPPGTQAGRRHAIDGLRGFLALAVFFHHAAVYRGFLTNGSWTVPPSRFYTVIGPLGVSMFFIITGYLFWGRLIRAAGRLDWITFAVGRVFRIGPLYLAAVAFMLIAVLAAQGGQLHTSLAAVAAAMPDWLELGYVIGPDIDGYDRTWSLLAGVTWTLHYEWLFYLSLPVLALATRMAPLILPMVAIALVVCLARAAADPAMVEPIFASLFGLGMLVATLEQADHLPRLPRAAGSALLVAILIGIFQFDRTYTPLPMLLIGLAFALIVGGADGFGLLVCRPARRLGDISYGLYLLQGLALAAAFRPAALRRYALAAPLHHWLLTLAAGTALIGLASVTYVWIERPCMRLGRRGGAGLSAWARRVAALAARSGLPVSGRSPKGLKDAGPDAA